MFSENKQKAPSLRLEKTDKNLIIISYTCKMLLKFSWGEISKCYTKTKT